MAGQTREREPLSPGAVPIISTLIIAAFVMILNETVVGLAIPNISDDLDVSRTTAGWVVTVFMLTMAVLIPTTGFLLQRFSTRLIFAIAMTSFIVGTLVNVVSISFAMLIIGRILQAGGTAMMMPMLMTSILTLVPVSRRGAMMGNLMIVISMAPAMGPFISGIITQNFNWRMIFVFVLPIAITAFLIGLKYLQNVGEHSQNKLDLLSVLLTVPGFGGIVYGISQFGGEGSGENANLMIPITAIIIGVISLVAFVMRQLFLQRTAEPLLDLRVFTYPMFRIGLLTMVAASMAFFGAVILMPLMMLDGMGFQNDVVGLVLLPGGLMMGLSGPIVGRLFDRFGPRPLLMIGGVVLTGLLLFFANIPQDATPLTVAIVYAFTGIALSLVFSPSFTASLNPLPPHLYSHGSAMLSTLQQMAGAVGTALLMAALAIGTAATGDFMSGVHIAFYVAAAISVSVIVLAQFTHKASSQEMAREEAEREAHSAHV